MAKCYYAKKREIFNKEVKKVRECYTPVVIINKKECYVSSNDKIIELQNKDEALKIAKETYFKFIEKTINE